MDLKTLLGFLFILVLFHAMINITALIAIKDAVYKERLPKPFTAIVEYDHKTCYIYDVPKKPFREVCIYGPERRTY